MRPVDADVIIKALDEALDEAREAGANVMEVLEMKLFKNLVEAVIRHTPTIEIEITSEQVREYCRKRNLVIVTRELFTEMMKRSEAARVDEWEEPEINPCRGCDDYDGRGGCKSAGGCGRC
jgi:hypothetical protein